MYPAKGGAEGLKVGSRRRVVRARVLHERLSRRAQCLRPCLLLQARRLEASTFLQPRRRPCRSGKDQAHLGLMWP